MTVFNRLAASKEVLLDEVERPGSVVDRRAGLNLPHVAPLERWARDISKAEDEHVPSFDPRSAGVEAKLLVLLQDPSRAAAYGSRFISIDNNDQTAHNCSKAYEATGLDYGEALHWNVIPWWVDDPQRAHERDRTLVAQSRRARPYLAALISMLPRLQAVVLLGKHA